MIVSEYQIGGIWLLHLI